ncbi:glycoside hydrolase family 20 protein [Anaerorudis cellulosivorans]|uniref:glycoside hydrolase family 20 protein n=1 Tax=Anaerorudis cellulosivorans TaxID=3397862 RepID=UPI00221E85D5|nr:glycoside hydrolase family 20 protein [Seramator thermalis]MCW1735185.1 glycoside hydrolase family 20 protein [Seramator thermalis]
MKKISCFIISLATAGLLFSCSGKKEMREANYQVVPLPAEITTENGTPFTLSKATKIVFPQENEKMQRNAQFLAAYLEISTGIKPEITTTAPQKNAVILALDAVNENPEAYRIEVNENTITITGSSEAGVFYGIQTLRKATPVGENISVMYPQVIINDQPRFGYRGMMLDVARHFEPADFVKKYIDMLALHNINRFHWHLTDDQGWRIEIKKFPKLTEIGAFRKETVIGKNTGKYDGKPHGGFYTQDEISDIVKYAEERYITIIPEIDLPGHMLSALAAYPELGCTGGPYEVAKEWGVFEDVLCPGKEATFEFLEGVLSEVMELFPSKYIHIGGDECPKVRWEKCPDCQRRIKELGLKDDSKHTAEHYLQSYVTARIEKFLNDHGRNIIGWDEILEGELAPNATVMSWRGMEGGILAAQMNHDVIMTPTSYCYFDYYQTQDIENEPLSIGGYVPIEKVYSFEPVPEVLTPEQKKHILGPQANLWTEYIKTPEHVEYMVMPRIAALCEVQWLQPEKKNYEEFLKRLPRLLALYDKLGYHYATHVFDIQAKLMPNFETNALNVELSTIDDAPIYYTLNGEEPTTSSTLYEGSFTIKGDAEIKAVAIRENGKNSKIFHEKVKVSKSTFKPIVLLTQPAPNYAFSGPGMLVDGLFGKSSNYKTGRWMGFQNEDLIAVIDMLEPTGISKAEIRNAVVTGDWVFDASEITIASSNNDSVFTTVKSEKYIDAKMENWSDVVTHTLTFDPVTARYFKVTVKPSIIPAWHPGKGNRAFIFVDEIVLD